MIHYLRHSQYMFSAIAVYSYPVLPLLQRHYVRQYQVVHITCFFAKTKKINPLELKGTVYIPNAAEGGVDSSTQLERRHGSARVPGHAFFTWHSYWRMVVNYIFYKTAAGNSISLQLGSSCQGNLPTWQFLTRQEWTVNKKGLPPPPKNSFSRPKGMTKVRPHQWREF